MGQPIPKFITEAPLIEDAYQQNILAAFWKLSTCRALGMSVGPIPWSAIDAFAVRHHYDIDEIEYETFMYLIFQMDGVFMAYAEEERKKQEAKNGNTRTVRKSAPAHRIRSR